MEDELEEKLEGAREAIYEVLLAHLRGVRADESSRKRLWAHLGDVLNMLAIMQADTPKSIAEQAFGFAPTDQEWRNEVLPRYTARAHALDNYEIDSDWAEPET